MKNNPRSTYHRRSMTLQERLDDMRVVAPNGCWIWTGSNDGYGRITVERHRVRKAHVVSYELNVGPIAHGLELDHLCGEPLCINWRHLEAVPHRENMLRAKNTVTGANAAKTHCKRGHAFAENAVVRGGRRHCLLCERDYRKSYYEANRERMRGYARKHYYSHHEKQLARNRARHERERDRPASREEVI